MEIIEVILNVDVITEDASSFLPDTNILVIAGITLIAKGYIRFGDKLFKGTAVEV